MTAADILITGGGTGGHVYPALALAEELVRRGRSRDSLLFVGAARGMEAQAVPGAGFRIELLPGRGFQRRLHPAAIVANLGALAGLVRALVRAWRIVGRARPRVVVGVGGFASVPTVIAARARRVPVVVHEQNAAPGAANRLACRLGARPAVAIPGTPLPHAVVVGNPVRAAIFGEERRPTPERPLVLATGGSLGAGSVNRAVLGLAARWRARGDVRIRHVSGPRNHDACAEALAAERTPADRLEYVLVGYEDRMERWYAEASVVVCRAGALTVAELAAAGVPAVLVPLPGAPADHQTRNAEAMATAGAAVLLPDVECTSDRLATVLDELLADPRRLDAMGEAARSQAHPSAAADLADLVEAAMAGAG